MTDFTSPDTEAPKREREERNAELPDFFKMKDLVGRNVIIVPEKIETVPDGKFGPYDKVTASVVIVLDGKKNDLFPKFPRWQRNVWIFDNNVVAELRKPLQEGSKILAYVGVDDRNRLFLEDSDSDVNQKAQDAWKLYESSVDQAQDEAPPF